MSIARTESQSCASHARLPRIRSARTARFASREYIRRKASRSECRRICPCGWAGDPSGRNRCHLEANLRYRGKISGPLLERIELHVGVPRLPSAELRPEAPPGESSDVVRARVVRKREVQRQRAGRCNAHLGQTETSAFCRPAPEDQAMLENAIDLVQLSARTIADLAGSAEILGPHASESIGYRRGERAVSS